MMLALLPVPHFWGWEFACMYTKKTDINTSWKVHAYSIYARDVDVSEFKQVRFLIQKQRVHKYHT